MTSNQPFSYYLQPKLLAILFLGFVSGLPYCLATSTLQVWLTEVGVSITDIGIFALVTLPYTLKFIWSPLIDLVPIPYLYKKLGHRTSWLIVAQSLLMLSIIALGHTDPLQNKFLTGICAFIMVLCASTQDAVVDAYRIESVKSEEQGAATAMLVLGWRIGMLFTGAGALFLSEYYSWSFVYTISALGTVVGMITVLIMREPQFTIPLEKKPNIKNISIDLFIKRILLEPFIEFTKHRGWLIIFMFAFFFKLGDSMAQAVTQPFLIQIGFSKSEIATISKLFGLMATIIGAFVGGFLIQRLGMLRVLWIAGIFQMLSNLLFVVQAYVGYDLTYLALTIGIENLASGIGVIAMTTYLSSLCNLNFTATQYALLSAIIAMSRNVFSGVSGKLVEVMDWIPFFFTTTVIAIPGLLLLYFIRIENKTN